MKSRKVWAKVWDMAGALYVESLEDVRKETPVTGNVLYG